MSEQQKNKAAKAASKAKPVAAAVSTAAETQASEVIGVAEPVVTPEAAVPAPVAEVAEVAEPVAAPAPAKRVRKPAAPKRAKVAVPAAKADKVEKADKAVSKAADGAAEKAQEKPRKVRLVRDSFTMPEHEYVRIGELKRRLQALGQGMKKSELLRAGLLLLDALNEVELKAVCARVERIKTGRPAKK